MSANSKTGKRHLSVDNREKVSTVKQSPKRRKIDRENGDTKAIENETASPQNAKHASRAMDFPGKIKQHTPPAHGSDWSIFPSSGGRFLDHSPVFAPDSKHLVLASGRTIQIYSIATSSLVQKFKVPESAGNITAYKISAARSDFLYVSTESSAIFLWEWTSGKEIERWKNEHMVQDLAIGLLSTPDGQQKRDIVFTMCSRTDRQQYIVLNVRNDKSGWKTRIISRSTPRDFMVVTADGRIVVTVSGDHINIGYAETLSSESVFSNSYDWLELSLPVHTTSMDIRYIPGSSSKNDKKMRPLDLALGEQGGSILVYHDFLNTLIRKNTTSGTNIGAHLIPRRLHWHRNPVNAVRWSQDGNYIISGGSEKVQVLWQLDTGRKQFLPHLASQISNLTVSPAGSEYALSLANNSVIVLSTAELHPIAAITGLQVSPEDRLLASGSLRNCSPAVLHPLRSNYLLVAVSSSTSTSDSSANLSLLQTYDISRDRHISRQALTRTNASVLDVGPEGTRLTTPDITNLSITSDGQWMATTDEWSQYPANTSILHPASISNNTANYCEIYLKIWRWNQSKEEWVLNTQINSPHFSNLHGSMSVLDLVRNPSGVGFATIGGDSIVRLWTAGSRLKNGQREHDQQGRPLESWKCSLSVVLGETPLKSDGNDPSHARMCYSPDGSVLVVSLSGSVSKEVIYLVDPATGRVRHSRNGLHSGPVREMNFLGQQLFILSNQLAIWDMSTDKVQSFQLDIEATRAVQAFSLNPTSQTFAISFEKDAKGASLLVFDARSLQIVLQEELQDGCQILLPDYRTGGYVVVDFTSSVHQALPSESGSGPPETIEAATSAALNLKDIFGSISSETLPVSVRTDDQDRFTARSSGLTQIFDAGPSFVLPGVSSLFKNVVDLVMHSTSVKQ